MVRILSLLPVAAVLLLGSVPAADAHCEVPCGVFHDQMRFEMMLEDHETIAKAMTQIQALADKTDAASINQRTRWIMTKEDHGNKTMETISQYFMAQRIKPANDEAGHKVYLDQLTKAHAVMRAAMKCKQSVDTKDADALRTSVLAFHQAYEGKK